VVVLVNRRELLGLAEQAVVATEKLAQQMVAQERLTQAAVAAAAVTILTALQHRAAQAAPALSSSSTPYPFNLS
jgi:hypothetical protein